MISVSSFANQSCPVRDSPNGNTAYLSVSDVKADGNGCIKIPAALTKPSQGETTLLIEVRDSDGKLIGTADVTMQDGNKTDRSGNDKYCGLKSGQWYSISLARATCIAGW